MRLSPYIYMIKQHCNYSEGIIEVSGKTKAYLTKHGWRGESWLLVYSLIVLALLPGVIRFNIVSGKFNVEINSGPCRD